MSLPVHIVCKLPSHEKSPILSSFPLKPSKTRPFFITLYFPELLNNQHKLFIHITLNPAPGALFLRLLPV